MELILPVPYIEAMLLKKEEGIQKGYGDNRNFKETPEYWIDNDNYANGHEIDIFNPSNFAAIEVSKIELKQVTDKIEEELEILKEEIEVKAK